MPATIRDIKERTGLSLATISKYLNGGNVLPENKEKIEAAIKELHYEVNELARGLVTKRTRIVGVVVYSIESLFSGTLLRYIGDRLRSKGYGMLICDSCNDAATEAENIRFLVNRKVDGIIVIPIAKTSEFLKPAKRAGIPVVLLDRTLKDAALDCVSIDNRVSAYRAVSKIIDCDHKKIAIICSKTEYTGLERFKGYREALEEAGIELDERYQFVGSHSVEFGYESMNDLLKMEDRPTAVFMTNYEITLGAITALNESPYKCPEDISMLGFDNLLLTHLVKPPMVLVEQPMQEMGEKVVDLLLRRIEKIEKGAPVKIVMGTKIVEGKSVKKIQ